MSTSYASVTLGPVRLHGVSVLLRPPVFGDFAEWRRIRLRDRDCLEPYWFRSSLTWEQRHTATRWVRECLTARTEAKAGRRVSTVLEIDGRFAGQIELVSIDSGAAELSVWVDAEVARRGASGLAGSLLLDFAFDTVGLDRITAPIAVTNAGARRAVRQRWTMEAVMRGYFDVGSGRTDHELWAVTSDRVPVGGFAADWRNGYLATHPGHGADSPRREPVRSSDATAPEATISRYTVLRARARYCLGTLRHVADPLCSATLGPAPDEHGQVALRPWRSGDFEPRRAARIAARPLLAPAAAPEKWAGCHTRLEWWRARASSRKGLRGPYGAVLVIEEAGRYVGECRLFDQDMFDRNVRAALWVSPQAHPDTAVSALRLLTTHATERLGIWRLVLAVSTTDPVGSAVALAAGLRHEGTMHRYRGVDGELTDHELWAFSKTPAVRTPEAGGEYL
ncbi:GNAT family N-acetyltransferase [Nocardia sp. A7]|uniref:GNAT family N-acetyltransferase n=1 Tax=Nocardia sp. A7 TaxID=2789274 RepID=UPI00397DBB7F